MKSSKKRTRERKDYCSKLLTMRKRCKMKNCGKHIVKTEKRWKMDKKEKNVKNASESKNEKGNE